MNQEAYDDSQSQQAADSQSQQAADRNEAFSGTENDAAPTSPPPVYDDQPEDNTGVNDDLNRRFRNIMQFLNILKLCLNDNILETL